MAKALLIPVDPRAEPRTRQALQKLAEVINGLIYAGILVEGPSPFWTLNLTGLVPVTGASQITTIKGTKVFLSDGPPKASIGGLEDVCVDVALNALYRKEGVDAMLPPKWVLKTTLGGPGPPGRDGKDGRQGGPGPAGPPGVGVTSTVFAEAVRTSNQTIADSTTTAISWSSMTRDDGPFWSAGSPTRITILSTGVYLLTHHVKWAANNNGKRVLDFRINGSTFRGSTAQGNFGAAYNDPDITSCLTRALVPGDYIESTLFQNSTGNLDITAAEFQITSQ